MRYFLRKSVEQCSGSVESSVPDPHHFGKLYQDPHQSGNLNPDPHQIEKQDADPLLIEG
jgi:hypothetical protein